jgi:hypothetical protein
MLQASDRHATTMLIRKLESIVGRTDTVAHVEEEARHRVLRRGWRELQALSCGYATMSP